MAKPNEIFANRILKIDGVKHFMLIKEDGLILSHNIENQDPDIISSIIILAGLGSESIKSSLGFTHFNHLMLSRKDAENFYVFPIEKYFLGVFQEQYPETSDTDENDKMRVAFVNKIVQFIEGITQKKGKSR